MRGNAILITAVATLFAGGALAQAPAPASAPAPAATTAPAGAIPTAKPTIPQICTNCHQAKPNALQGIYENVAFKSGAIQLKIDANTEIVRFDPKDLKVVDGGDPKPTEALRELPKNREARIDYVDKDGARWATKISFKGPIKIAPEKLVKYDQVVDLVAQGPEAGKYTLIDSRP